MGKYVCQLRILGGLRGQVCTILFVHLPDLNPVSSAAIFDTLIVCFIKSCSSSQGRSWKSRKRMKGKSVEDHP